MYSARLYLSYNTCYSTTFCSNMAFNLQYSCCTNVHIYIRLAVHKFPVCDASMYELYSGSPRKLL